MALISSGDNIAEIYRKALHDVYYLGEPTRPRGFYCLELTNYIIELKHPERNILTNPIRKINKAFAAAEFIWMGSGRNDVKFISQYNSKIADFSDNGKIFYGAYGPRIDRQMPQVIETLKKDPWSRQAVLTIWRQNPPKTKDVPCTIMMHFIRRPIDKLCLIVYMRSNDIWLGLPYDIHNFTCIQMMVAQELGIGLGTYSQIDGSLHAYSKDSMNIRRCMDNLNDNEYEETTYPVIEQKEKVMKEYMWRKKYESQDNKD
jgi:thymidylate synthase